jgi:uncharacterized membrane protein YjfL (UPF0719 family)
MTREKGPRPVAAAICGVSDSIWIIAAILSLWLSGSLARQGEFKQARRAANLAARLAVCGVLSGVVSVFLVKTVGCYGVLFWHGMCLVWGA